jgi:hypothetical protein
MDRRAMLARCLSWPELTGATWARRSVQALAKAAGRISIAGVEGFDIQMPAHGACASCPPYLGLTPGRNNVVKVTTSAGVSGYSFLGTVTGETEAARALTAGRPLRGGHLCEARGLGPAVEEAVWDADRHRGQPSAA